MRAGTLLAAHSVGTCYTLGEDLALTRKNGRSHISVSYWREGRGSPP